MTPEVVGLMPASWLQAMLKEAAFLCSHVPATARHRLPVPDASIDSAVELRQRAAWGEIVAGLPSLCAEQVIDVTEIFHVTEIVRDQGGKRPLAVASGSPRKRVPATLGAMGIAELFQVIVSLDDTQVG